MRPRIPMREALREPKLFGRILQGASWYGWRVLLIASAGEQLADDERLEFKRLTGREREPGRIVHELIAIFGRRAGKSLALAVFDCWLAALCDHRGVLAPGEVGVVLVISRDQRVAKVILNYVEGILRSSELLASLSPIALLTRSCSRTASASRFDRQTIGLWALEPDRAPGEGFDQCELDR